MANLPISQLPSTTAITKDTLFVCVASGTTYQVKSPYIGLGNLHGSFYSTVSQTAATTTSAYAMSAETTAFGQGITVVDGSKITTESGGTFNVQFSVQLDKSGGSAGIVSIWFRKNGTNIAYSNTDVTLANNNNLLVAAWNFVEELNAGEYIEIMWSTTNTNAFLVAAGAQTNPTRPETPSVIITMTQV
jgi:hypothetical protein